MIGFAMLQTQFSRLRDLVGAGSQAEWRDSILANFRQFHLLGEEGRWLLPELEKYGRRLLSENPHADLNVLLDSIEIGVTENPYLMRFLSSVENIKNREPLGEFLDHPKEIHQLKNLITFAFCLEGLNEILRRDLDLQEKLIRYYGDIRRREGFYRLKNILAVIKFHSIELPLKRFVEKRKSGRLKPNFSKYLLSLNIFEATMVDLLLGNFANAFSTLPLIFFSPNYQGLGIIRKFKRGKPSEISSDGKALRLHSPEPKAWADLYQVWNMAFVAQFSQAPYLLLKLLIPSVSRYSEHPEEYMHRRITALHLTLIYLDSAVNNPVLNLDLKRVPSLSRTAVKEWGRVNRECAKNYAEELKTISE